MPDAEQPAVRRQLLELHVDLRRLQVDPADDAGDERMQVGEREQPARFVECLQRLDGDAPLEAGAAHLALQVRRGEILLQGLHRVVYPAVLDGIVLPEVLMRVDSHADFIPGVAAGRQNCASGISVPPLSLD